VLAVVLSMMALVEIAASSRMILIDYFVQCKCQIYKILNKIQFSHGTFCNL